jgi:hypothetical protein
MGVADRSPARLCSMRKLCSPHGGISVTAVVSIRPGNGMARGNSDWKASHCSPVPSISSMTPLVVLITHPTSPARVANR